MRLHSGAYISRAIHEFSSATYESPFDHLKRHLTSLAIVRHILRDAHGAGDALTSLETRFRGLAHRNCRSAAHHSSLSALPTASSRKRGFTRDRHLALEQGNLHPRLRQALSNPSRRARFAPQSATKTRALVRPTRCLSSSCNLLPKGSTYAEKKFGWINHIFGEI